MIRKVRKTVKINEENIKFLESLNAGTINNAIVILRKYYEDRESKVDVKEINEFLKKIYESNNRIEHRLTFILPITAKS